MIIQLAEIWREQKRFRGEEPSSVLDLEGEKYLSVESPIRYDLTVSIAGGSLVAQGTVAVDISFVCGRCAERFRMEVADPSFLGVVEVDETTESVDLTTEIRESIILAFPANPLCSPDCRGMCCRCGMNLNTGSCTCSPPPEEDRWAALDGLKLGERGQDGRTKKKNIAKQNQDKKKR